MSSVTAAVARLGSRVARGLRHRLVFTVTEPVRAEVRTWVKAREVRAVRHRPELDAARIVAVMVLKDEAPRLPFVLDYYRRLGVEHFVVLDNRSTDDLRALLLPEPDVSVFAADGVYGRSRFGNDWVNRVLHRHCVGKWVLWVDADELLVFSARAEATLPQLVAELERRGQRSLQTMMLDMYSERPPDENVVGPGEDPLDVCPLYDRSGYRPYSDPHTRVTWIKGGVRGRLFFPDDLSRGPALNKTPLVRWRRHYWYLKSAHELWPAHLNGRARVEGILLHFKFTSTSVRKMVDAEVRSQHTAEYDRYTAVQETSFVGDVTGKFADGGSLVADGLFDPLL